MSNLLSERRERDTACIGVYTVDTVDNELWNRVRYLFMGIKI